MTTTWEYRRQRVPPKDVRVVLNMDARTFFAWRLLVCAELVTFIGAQLVAPEYPCFAIEAEIARGTPALRDITVGDVNGDGLLDIVAGGYHTAWLEHLPTGDFASHALPRDASFTYMSFVATGDLAGNGHTDIVSGANFFLGDNERPGIVWFENLDGDGGNWAWHNLTTQKGVRAIEIVDLDNDMDSDVLVAFQAGDGPVSSNRIVWYENLGSGSFSEEQEIVSGAQVERSSDVLAVDIDSDNKVDVVSASRNSGIVAWHRNIGTTGNASFAPPQTISSAVPHVTSIHSAYVDTDGQVDILSASTVTGIQWHRYNGSVWETYDVSSSGSEPDFVGLSAVFAADLDLDDRVDVVAAFGGGIVWFKNTLTPDLSGGFSEQMIVFDDIATPLTVLGVNFSQNGPLDVLTVSEDDEKISLIISGPCPPSPTPTPVKSLVDAILEPAPICVIVVSIIVSIAFCGSKLVERQRSKRLPKDESIGSDAGSSRDLLSSQSRAAVAVGDLKAGGDHTKILLIGLALLDFVVDWIFVVDRRSKRSLVANDGLSESYLELIFTLAVTFVVVPMLINFALCIMLVKRESQNDQMRKWYRDNTSFAAALAILSLGNADTLALITSRIFGSTAAAAAAGGSRRFNAPLTAESRYQFLWLGFAGNVFEDMPQIVLQVVVLAIEGSTVITVISFVTSTLALFVGIVRLVNLFSILEKHSAEAEADASAKGEVELAAKSVYGGDDDRPKPGSDHDRPKPGGNDRPKPGGDERLSSVLRGGGVSSPTSASSVASGVSSLPVSIPGTGNVGHRYSELSSVDVVSPSLSGSVLSRGPSPRPTIQAQHEREQFQRNRMHDDTNPLVQRSARGDQGERLSSISNIEKRATPSDVPAVAVVQQRHANESTSAGDTRRSLHDTRSSVGYTRTHDAITFDKAAFEIAAQQVHEKDAIQQLRAVAQHGGAPLEKMSFTNYQLPMNTALATTRPNPNEQASSSAPRVVAHRRHQSDLGPQNPISHSSSIPPHSFEDGNRSSDKELSLPSQPGQSSQGAHRFGSNPGHADDARSVERKRGGSAVSNSHVEKASGQARTGSSFHAPVLNIDAIRAKSRQVKGVAKQKNTRLSFTNYKLPTMLENATGDSIKNSYTKNPKESTALSYTKEPPNVSYTKNPKESTAPSYSKEPAGPSYTRNPKESTALSYTKEPAGPSYTRNPKESTAPSYTKEPAGPSYTRNPKESTALSYTKEPTGISYAEPPKESTALSYTKEPTGISYAETPKESTALSYTKEPTGISYAKSIRESTALSYTKERTGPSYTQDKGETATPSYTNKPTGPSYTQDKRETAGPAYMDTGLTTSFSINRKFS